MQFDRTDLHNFAADYTAAWCSGDPARVAAFYSPQASLTVNDGPPALGRDAIREVAESFMTAFPDMRVIMDKLPATNERTEYHWTLTGTNTGMGGSGHRVCISGVEVADWEGWFDRKFTRLLRCC